MIYFLFKKMTFESWGKEEAKEGNEIAITMGFRTINVPAVIIHFYFKKMNLPKEEEQILMK